MEWNLNGYYKFNEAFLERQKKRGFRWTDKIPKIFYVKNGREQCSTYRFGIHKEWVSPVKPLKVLVYVFANKTRSLFSSVIEGE